MGSIRLAGVHSIGTCSLRGVLVALALLVGLQACSNETIQGDSAETDVDVLTDEDFSLTELAGQPISFKGEFLDQVSESIFRVEAVDLEPEGLEELDSILVINQTEESFRVPGNEETPIWILGEVQPLTLEDLEDNQVSPDLQEELEGQPAVMAESVTLAPDPEDLVENADAFLNQTVTVFGNIELTDNPDTLVVENPGLFQGKGVVVIEGSDAELFKAVGPEQAAVSGVLRPYVLADLEEEYDLVWDLSLQEEIEAEFKQSPVIVASEVYPVESDEE